MNDGQILLKLQELDLSLERDRAVLQDMPEIRNLAKKRKAYVSMKQDLTRLLAERKDLEHEIAEMDENKAFCERASEQATAEMAQTSDARAIRDYQQQLSGIAKRMDKLRFARKDRIAQLERIEKAQAYAQGYVEKFEGSVKDDTREAREKAQAIQDRIKVNETQRAAVANMAKPEILERYAAAYKKYRGLAVESLEGDVPSICRMTLQTSMKDEVKGAGQVTECPYCHRILVLSTEGID